MITPAGPETNLKRSYEENGVVNIAGVLEPVEVDAIRDAFMAQVEGDKASLAHDDNVPDDDILARYPRFVHPHRHPELGVGRLARKYMLDRRILDKVEATIGPVNGAQSMFYFKPPKARGQALHQDNLFLQSHPETCIAVWIAIDPVDEDNGGLQVVPGSHNYELVCPGDADSETSFSRQAIHLPRGMTAEQTLMAPGDALLFHGSMVHGSGPNRTTDRFRRSLIFHYVPQSSTKIAKFYLPLISPTGKEVFVSESTEGGVCGDGWVPSGPH
ncbi:phytanoyl-dioxygenase family protein [Penicillium riverlandense]|uniref:phytanoyl-dioxygenase family protein n=1 Tax=Penicillium riverlandense TaxID=1903569 RepID=UPI0025482A5E|nr:phytanoyl-dioxygenase family protein [Penicillium riverlandense]KAJ5819347.1 phytanoyl-dioxygenase family protein [Penicillium riverlandense]